MTDTPSWLTDMVTQMAPEAPRRPATTPTKQAGQIWRALAMDRTDASALTLVLDIDEDSHHATVALLTPDIELAGSRDFLLLGNDTGAGYDLAAQTELVSSVWVVQLDAYIGEAPVEQLNTIHEMVEDGEFSPQRTRLAGPPVVEPNDPRWTFKRTELRRLQTLSSECVRQLIDGEAVRLLPDPSALRITADANENLDLQEYVLAVLDATGDGRMDLPVWLVEQMFEDPESLAILRSSGLFDIVRALLGRAVDRLGAESPQLTRGTLSDPKDSNHYDDMRHTLLAQAQSTGATNVAFVVRTSDYDRRDPLTRTYIHEHLMQCATVQDRTIGRKY